VIRRFISERPALGVGAFTLIWALMEIIAPLTGVSPYEIVWTRYGIHLLVMAMIVGRRQGLSFVRTKQPAREIFASLLMLGMPVFFVFAARRMPIQDTLAVFWVAPALIIGFGVLFGHPLGGFRTVASVVLGLVGALLICKPDSGMLRPAAIFALGMSACFALYVVMMGTIRTDAISTKLFHTALWVFVILTLDVTRFWHMPTAQGFAALTLIAVLGLGGLYLLDAALEKTTPTIIAPLLYMQIAWDAALHMLRHWQRFGQLPDRATLVGAVIVFAVSVPILFRRRWPTPVPASTLSEHAAD
jgi:hypothetical protein